MYKVVATYYLQGADLGEEQVRNAGGEIVKSLCKIGPEAHEDEILAACQDADAVITVLQPFTRKVIGSLPKLRAICSISIGHEKIDIEAATECGVCVTNVPDYCLEEVSDHTMALILACARKLFPAYKATMAGKWDKAIPVEIRKKIQPPMFRLRSQTIGLLGFGNIARLVVPKAKGFGMKVIAYDPHLPAEAFQISDVQQVDLDYLLKESDFVSVHVPATTHTHHMIGAAELAKMKPTAYLINTARGTIIDEKALIEALRNKQIAGAGLDVLEQEPPSMDNPLFAMDNVVVSPHMAQYSDEAEVELLRRPGENAAMVLSGKWPRNLVNPRVKKQFIARWGEMK